MELLNIKDYDSFIEYTLNEGQLLGEQHVCNKAFINGGLIKFADGSSVHPRDIVRVVEEALSYLRSDYRKTFIFGDETLTIIYLAHSNQIKTMAVDGNMNLYLNAGFVFHELKMDKLLVAAVLMHEVFHALFNHIERGKNWLVAKGKPNNASNWHDTNLAADVEVNRTLVRIGLIDEDRLVNEIHGMYLKKEDNSRDVVTMETILNDEDYMNKLRQMCPPEPDPEQGKQETIKTSEEWDKGYKDAWTKIAELIKKYGYKDVWQKLQDEGIINSMGEVISDTFIDDVKVLEYMQIKSYNEYITEGKDSKYQTYDDGFSTAFRKLIGTIKSAIDGGGDSSSDGMDINSPTGPQIQSNLSDEDLPQIELPLPKNKGKNSSGNNMPQNIKNTNQDDVDLGGKQSDDNNRGDGQGKSISEPGDEDENKLADDLESRGGETSNISEPEFSKKSIGGTGSFQEEGLSDEELKNSGYSDEDLAEINKIREQNKTKNSKERLEEVIEKQKKALSSGHILKKYLDAIEVESEKYKNIWKKILDKFLAKRTRRAGKDSPSGSNDWLNKRHIARGEYAIHRKNQSKDPQDINVYVDVSGSVDMELLEIIAKSLVIYMKTYEYSGINICPWASTNNGVFKVEASNKRDEKEIVKEILSIISNGVNQCGGGTEAKAMISAMLDGIEASLDDKNKKAKDDVHIVITDGYFDYQNIESNMKNIILRAFNRGDVSDIVPKNTFWMLYDTNEMYRKEWENEIQKGTLLFINREVVKNNK